ncbi:LOB domain-containing protein 12-like [Rutidosis leptorrhynchoides]|uniref:LOB domain-containing protein 12-like n=1 Tax=Rutidosis leptorrhynchoides TaxID=125765 RepID=UPI003A9A3F53
MLEALSKARRHSPCASCKLLRRRCTKDCIFAPYFPPEEPHKFAIVHKVFGASNVSKMLQELPRHQRADAVSSLVYEANARTRDPVYGCVGAIFYLQNQVSQLQVQLAMAQTEMLCIQMNQEPLAPASADQDVISRVSSDDVSYSCLHNITNHHQYFNFNSTNVIQYNNLKRESSSLWT